jgi:hypothetical protein
LAAVYLSTSGTSWFRAEVRKPHPVVLHKCVELAEVGTSIFKIDK